MILCQENPTERQVMADDDARVKDEGSEGEDEQDYKALFEAASAILGHLRPGIVVDDELGNVAVKPDGTPVYVGELEAAKPAEPAEVEEGKTSQKVLPPRKRKPYASRSPALGRGGGKPKVDIDSMTIEERANLYEKHIEKGYKS